MEPSRQTATGSECVAPTRRGERMAQLIEEMSAGPARVRVDVIGREVPEHVLENMDFLNYRLADVRLEPKVTLGAPDMVWDKDAPAKKGAYVDGVRHFGGAWEA